MSSLNPISAPGKVESIRPLDLWHSLPPDELVPTTLTNKQGERRDWSHKNVKVEELNSNVGTGKGIVVAVLDTGIDLGHSSFKGQIVEAKDFTGSRTGPSDVQGHGTHVAGTIAAIRGAGTIGVAPDCKLLIAKVLNDNGSGLGSWIAAGIDWAIAHPSKPRIISMSLGSKSNDPTIEAAVKRAFAAGLIVIAAAGNDGPNEGTIGFPGAQGGVWAVAATDERDRVAGFSSRGRNVLIAAPGVNIEAAYPGNRHATMSGTSMATPLVAGYVACILSRDPKWVPDWTRLTDLGVPGRDTAYGWGLINPGLYVATAPPPPKKDKGFTGLVDVTIEFVDGVPVGVKLKK